ASASPNATADVWHQIGDVSVLRRELDDLRDEIIQDYQQQLRESPAIAQEQAKLLLQNILERESRAAGALNYLRIHFDPGLFQPYVFHPQKNINPNALVWLLEMFDPARSDLLRAAISPIGILHLHRQYFFEFDSFLGPPVQHVWLSPGSSV